MHAYYGYDKEQSVGYMHVYRQYYNIYIDILQSLLLTYVCMTGPLQCTI